MNTRIVLDFIKAINSADIDAIYFLMTEDHAFVDSQNNKVIGRDAMKQAWINFLKLFPDYHIEVNETLTKENIVMVTGIASGTYKNLKHEEIETSCIISACFKAIIKEEKIELWQIFADMSKAYEIVRRYSGS